jgi:hypothetical protein
VTWAADTNYNGATRDQSTTATKIDPTVTFTGAPATAPFQGTFTVASSTNSSASPVYTASGVCSNGGTTLYTMTSGTGTCTSTVTWAEDTNYKGATRNQTTGATKINPTVTFTGAPATAPYQGTFTVASTTNSSASPVYTASGVCSNDIAEYTMTSGTGSCTSTVTWAADTNYNGATRNQTTGATKINPTVTFTDAPATALFLGTFTVASSTNSTASPVYTASGVCSNVATLYTMTSGSGTCTSTVTWAADSNYNGATRNQTTTAEPRAALVNYIGQTVFVTSGTSATTAQVTLSASLQDPTGSYLSGAKVDFIEDSTGAILAKGVVVSPVSGSPYTGTANAVVTLNSGQYGSNLYIIRVVATGNYTNSAQPPADKTAMVVVSKPAATNQIIGGGTIELLGSAAGTYRGDDIVTYSIGVNYNKSGSNLQGQILLSIPQADGSIVYVKSNSLSSMAVVASPKSATIYSKASILRDFNGTITPLDGNVTLRVDGYDNGSTGDTIGFTVLSTKDSTLYYSNKWVLDTNKSPNVWKTLPQALEGSFTIN